MHFLPSLAFYVDPGSGSMVLQLLLGGVSGLYVIFRIFKQKILGVFGLHTEQPVVVDQPHIEVPNEDHLRRQA